jgi:dihydrolipoamide dehydrogenase
MTARTIRVPNIGDFHDVEVIEVFVAPGDRVEVETPILMIESDKASIEIPSPAAGVVQELLLGVGDRVSEGTEILALEVTGAEATSEANADESTEGEADEEPAAQAPEPTPAPAPASASPAPAASADTSRDESHADVLVLGAGPGGYTAAFRAADLGKRVILVERHPTLGGVCLNVGCIPSKALLHVAEGIAMARELAERGVDFGTPRIDLAKLRESKDAVVGRLTAGLADLARKRGVRVVTGAGRFTGAREISVETAEGTRALTFDHAIIAAGSRPARLPGLPYDDPRVMDSTGALALAEVPRTLLVIGGGIIGLEMASVYHALGAEITVVELLDRLVPEADPDLVQPLQRRLTKQYAAIHLGTRVTNVESREDGLLVSFEGPKAPEPTLFDRVLVAVGRVPNGREIGVERLGVRVDERGFLPVDERQRTNVSHVYAIGDIVGTPMLAHKASHEGKVAAEAIAGLPSGFDALTIPSVAYTDPEIAWAGLTETQAKKQGIDVEVTTFPWAASGRALGIGRAEGLTKLLFSKETGRIVGAGIVGPHAGELIAEATLAIELGADAEDIALTIHAHPTLSETVAFAAEIAEGTITDLFLPKRR